MSNITQEQRLTDTVWRVRSRFPAPDVYYAMKGKHTIADGSVNPHIAAALREAAALITSQAQRIEQLASLLEDYREWLLNHSGRAWRCESCNRAMPEEAEVGGQTPDECWLCAECWQHAAENLAAGPECQCREPDGSPCVFWAMDGVPCPPCEEKARTNSAPGTSGARAIITERTGASPTYTFHRYLIDDPQIDFQTAAETITNNDGTGSATKNGSAPAEEDVRAEIREALASYDIERCSVGEVSALWSAILAAALEEKQAFAIPPNSMARAELYNAGQYSVLRAIRDSLRGGA